MWPCSWFKKRFKQKRLEMYKRFREEDDNRIIKYSTLMPEHGYDPEIEKQQLEKERAEMEEAIKRGSIPIIGSPYKKAETPGSLPPGVTPLPMAEAKPLRGRPRPFNNQCYSMEATETGRFSAAVPNQSNIPKEAGRPSGGITPQSEEGISLVEAAAVGLIAHELFKDNSDRFVPSEEEWKPIEAKMEEVDTSPKLEDTSDDWNAINQEIEDNTSSVDEPEQGGYDHEEQGGYNDESDTYGSDDD